MPDPLSLLLLGDSRDRQLFGQTIGRTCTGVPAGCQGMSNRHGRDAPFCYSFQWAMPATFPIESRWQSKGGSLCTRNASRLAAYGYMITYGVSPTPPYLHDFATHYHTGWSGGEEADAIGWRDDESNEPSNAKVNAVALAVEASTRFQQRATAFSRVAVVYSSFLWDAGRRAEHAPRQPVEQWAAEFERNYSAAVEHLSKALAMNDAANPARPPSVLALATPYDVLPAWKFYDASSNATERMVDFAANLVRRTARLGKLPLVDYRRAFRGSRRPLPELIDIWGHPTGAGVAIAWSTLQTALGVGVELE